MRRKNLNSELIKEYMVEALLLLMEKKSFEKITIGEITNNAGVNRSSYYRHFNMKEDLLRWYFYKIIGEIEKENVSFHDYTYSIFKTFLSHKRGILVIHQAQLSYLLLDALNACFHVNTTDTKSTLEQFQTAWHVGGTYNGMLLWFEHGMKESAQLMTDITLSFRPAGSLSLRDMKKA